MVTQPQELVPEPAADTSPARTGTAAPGARASRRQQGSAEPARRELRLELHRFIAANPNGWSHDQWTGLLGDLAALGYDTTDSDAIGLALERERLDLALAGIPGVGERRRTALLNRYPRLWDLRQAQADEIAQVQGVTPALARRIVDALR